MLPGRLSKVQLATGSEIILSTERHINVVNLACSHEIAAINNVVHIAFHG